MYQHFYGLRELPFELTPNPKYLFLHAAASRGAEQSPVRAVFGQGRSRVLIGEAGTGKTTLLHAALESERCRT